MRSVKLRCICGSVELHDLRTLASVWIITQGLPFEADLRNSVLHIWVSLEFPSLILLMKQLKSHVLAIECSPYGIYHFLCRLLQLADIYCTDVTDVASELTLHCMVYVEDCKSLNLK